MRLIGIAMVCRSPSHLPHGHDAVDFFDVKTVGEILYLVHDTGSDARTTDFKTKLFFSFD
jgi:hypothetical protein